MKLFLNYIQKYIEDTMSQPEWIAKGLVVVKYPKDDPIGMFFGYYSLLVYQIQAVYITLFIRNRDLLTFWCCFTHLISEILNYLLKNLLKHPRPEHGAPGGGLFEGRYGMPSQHCHCIAYLSTMVFLLIFHYYRKHVSIFWKGVSFIMLVLVLTLQTVGRIYLKFHTLNQCLVGVFFGSISALIFYSIGLKIFLPYSNKLCNLWPLRKLYFRRDLVSHSTKINLKLKNKHR